METFIKLEKKDINTTMHGINVRVFVDEKVSLIFSQDAIEELCNDWQEMKKELRQDEAKQLTNQLEFEFIYSDEETGVLN